jgi:hypothetical protein
LRKLRIAAPVQLRLDMPEVATTPLERWWSLPPRAQEAVVDILARMISDGVVDNDGESVADDAHL